MMAKRGSAVNDKPKRDAQFIFLWKLSRPERRG
jgi:nuclear transport factor 2 (NTF2) superfamily protein